MVLIKKWRNIRDLRGNFTVVLTDLSKAFSCSSHDLLIAKLGAFNFDKKSLAFISAYLKYGKQRTKVGPAFSDFLNIPYGVSQGSIVSLLLFVIFIADLFYINDNLYYAGYAGDTILSGFNFAEGINCLGPNIQKVFAWFGQNGMMANSGISHFLVARSKKQI